MPTPLQTLLRLFSIVSLLAAAGCGGGGGGGGDGVGSGAGSETPAPGTAPKVVWSIQDGVKNPVTDLAGCAEAVMACVKNGTALKDCIGTEVAVCTGAEPLDGCCMQVCGDQIAQFLGAGTSEQDAFLKVFVYDGTCMPGIEEGTRR